MVRNRRHLPACLALLSAAMLCSGCDSAQKKTLDPAKQGTISGSVTKDGKAVPEKCSVVFHSAESAATAAGTTDASGKYSLVAADPAIGIPAGSYQVMVRPPEAPAEKVSSDEYKKKMMAGMPMQSAENSSDIPVKFQAFDTSGIVMEVKVGPNTFDIDLAKLGK